MAIWKSAAFGSAPPITPCSISSSTRSISAGQARRGRARTCSSVAWLKRRAADRDTARRCAPRSRHGNAEPGALEVGRERRAVAPQRAQTSRRGTGWSTSSPHASASSTSRRRSGSAGNSGGDGTARRAPARSPSCPGPWPRRAASPARCCAGSRAPADHPLRRRDQVDAAVLDALVLEHQLRRERRMRGRHGEQGRAHAPILRQVVRESCARTELGSRRIIRVAGGGQARNERLAQEPIQVEVGLDLDSGAVHGRGVRRNGMRRDVCTSFKVRPSRTSITCNVRVRLTHV